MSSLADSLKRKMKNIIERNLKLVENGKALDTPLAVLDGDFKLAYSKKYDVNIPLTRSFVNWSLDKKGRFKKSCIICGGMFKTRKTKKIICNKKSCHKKYDKIVSRVYNRNPVQRLKIQEYQVEWGKNNKDKLRRYSKRYWNKHKEEVLKSQREYYCKNRSKLLEKNRLWRLKNRDALRIKDRERKRKYYYQNKEKERKRKRKYYQKKKEKKIE